MLPGVVRTIQSACWMERNVEVQNALPTVFDDEEAVQRYGTKDSER